MPTLCVTDVPQAPNPSQLEETHNDDANDPFKNITKAKTPLQILHREMISRSRLLGLEVNPVCAEFWHKVIVEFENLRPAEMARYVRLSALSKSVAAWNRAKIKPTQAQLPVLPNSALAVVALPPPLQPADAPNGTQPQQSDVHIAHRSLQCGLCGATGAHPIQDVCVNPCMGNDFEHRQLLEHRNLDHDLAVAKSRHEASADLQPLPLPKQALKNEILQHGSVMKVAQHFQASTKGEQKPRTKAEIFPDDVVYPTLCGALCKSVASVHIYSMYVTNADVTFAWSCLYM